MLEKLEKMVVSKLLYSYTPKLLRATLTVLSLLLAPCFQSAAQAQLVINEVMQSNVDCVMDELNEFPDSWVEVYNTGSTPVNLKDYRIGLTNDASQAWQLPMKDIASHRYQLIYCDKEAMGLHTDFRLESGKGGAVYLFKDNTVVDKIEGMKKQPAPNIAYGRQDDGTNTWGYMKTATPGTSNCGTLVTEMLGNPVFSEQGRVFTTGTTVSLKLSVPDGTPTDAVIRYTTDGSEPTGNSTRYSSPLNILRTTVVRAKLFCNGWMSPRSTTQSYIFLGREQTLPVVSIATDNNYLYDSKIGIYVDGNYNSGRKNYEYNWRRPMNVEFFMNSGEESIINQLGEGRVAGGATRGSKLKTIALYANKRFGTKRFNYEFFPDQRPGVTDFKSLLLRNAGNDFDYLYMRDIIAQRTMSSHVDLDWQAWRPAIVYINGYYKGMLNIRERSNEDNIYTNYGGLEDIDMFENWWELKEGTWDNYNAFKVFYNEHGHTMAEYEQWMDCQEFINLMATAIYFNNIDFPGNNIVMWRPRTEDGRWRWIAKDIDYTMFLYGQADYNYRYLNWLYQPDYDGAFNWGANSYEATRLYRRLMEDADFKREMIDHLAVYMGDFLNYDGIWRVWEPMYNKIKTEYPNHRKLFNEWWPNYNDEMTKVKTWLQKRTDFVYQHIANYYSLGTPQRLLVNTDLPKEDREAIDFTINGIPLSEGCFNGKFYYQRPVKIKGTTKGNREVVGWKVTRNTGTYSNVVDITGNSFSFNMPGCDSYVINAVLGDGAGIYDVNVDDNGNGNGNDNKVYNLSGQRVGNGYRGIVIRNGKKVILTTPQPYNPTTLQP